MKQICVYMCMFLVFAACSTVQSDREDGGTSIEVVSTITGTVKRADSSVVENARISIITLHNGGDQSTEVARDTTRSDGSGVFQKRITRTGAIGIEIKDQSGLGAFKACTLVTTDTVVDVGSVVLEELSRVRITISDGEQDSLKNFFVWCREIGWLYEPDSVGLYVMDTIAAGEYNFRMSPRYLTLYQKFEIVDTQINIAPGCDTAIVLQARGLETSHIDEQLQADINVVKSILSENGQDVTNMTIPYGVGILNGRVSHFIQMSRSNLRHLSPDISKLDKLEWILLDRVPTLQSLPESIGQLQNLVRLSIRFCDSIKTVPNSVANLKNLEILEYSVNPSTVDIPEAFFHIDHVDYTVIDIDLDHYPNISEQEFILKHKFHGDEERFSVWIDSLENEFGVE